jgi:hypothetical protein
MDTKLCYDLTPDNAVPVASINSCGIRAQALVDGIDFITPLGDNGKTGDARVNVYQFGDVRVADTNGDPVWEESDHAGFAELLEWAGVKL